MSYLLDTHTLIWAVTTPYKLSTKTTEIIEDPNNRIFVSAITFWEISLKFSLGKLDLYGRTPEMLVDATTKAGFTHLSLSSKEASEYYQLEAAWHRDPFDRMLIRQAIDHNLTLISKDKTIAQYQSVGLKVLW